MDTLIIEVGGKLTALHDDQTTTTDVSDAAPTLLFEPCELAAKVTLRDIFLLIERHIDVFDKLLGNWCKKLTEEALSARDFEPVSEIQYLELMFYLELDDGNLYGMDRPDFHGVGKNQEDYSIVFSPTYQIVDLPLVLGGVKTQSGEKYQTTFTLGKILHGILWELSFYGAPKDRDEKAQEISKFSELFKSGSFDYEEFFSDDE